MGRGMFATKDLKKGELLIVEKAVAAGIQKISKNVTANDVMIKLAS
jgi:hypothetical protein